MKTGNHHNAEEKPKKTAHDWRKRQAEIKAELDRIDREIELQEAARTPRPEHVRD